MSGKNFIHNTSLYKMKPIEAENPLATQVGGDHYVGMKTQPIEYIHQNNIGFIAGAIIKYVSRYKNKNGVEDLQKAKHMIEILIQLETK